jgi:hypothetical protein
MLVTPSPHERSGCRDRPSCPRGLRPRAVYLAAFMVSLRALALVPFIVLVFGVTNVNARNTVRFDTTEIQAANEINAARTALARGQYRTSVEASYRAVKYFNELLHSYPRIANGNIAQAYLGTVEPLLAIRAGRELQSRLRDIATYADAADAATPQFAASAQNAFRFMSARRARFRAEYEAQRSFWGPHPAAGHEQLDSALAAAARGRPLAAIRLLDLDRTLSVAKKRADFYLAQDLYYYSAWLNVAAGNKTLAIKQFYTVLLHRPTGHDFAPDRDEVEAARFLGTQSPSALL